jgi:hypothetical protein
MVVARAVRNRFTRRFHARGLTVSGWARKHQLSIYSLRALLYGRESFRGLYGPKSQEIWKALLEDGLISRREIAQLKRGSGGRKTT